MRLKNDNLGRFIREEKRYIESIGVGIEWDDVLWDCSNWIFNRGTSNSISFNELRSMGRRNSSPLPHPYINFCKALIVYLQRTKKIGFISIHKYSIECRRIFQIMKERNENSPSALTRWHFERTLELLRENSYKNYYDASASLSVVANVIDSKQITSQLLDFKPETSPLNSRHNYIPMSEIDSDKSRKDDEKLPSYEAMVAYAECTNNPINNDEEILLRTIDLLVAMGQRGNEITLIPFDCWVETEQKSKGGSVVLNLRGEKIINVGIRYYAEKKSQDRVHWLADQDIPFAKRAVDRLKELTVKARTVSKWQEDNPGRIWDMDPKLILKDDKILEYISFANHYNLHLFLKRNGIHPVETTVDLSRISKRGNMSYKKSNSYLVGDVEHLLKSKFLKGHDQLKASNGKNLKSVLLTSEILSICFEGAFQFKLRDEFKVMISPQRLRIKDINGALGAFKGIQSIFERRKLTEADGSKIILTSHQPRHWRNTLYELAGMSNVQQALSMGRQRLDQNPTYQHTTLLERTQAHRDYLTFTTPKEKIQFLQNGIREKRILGPITNLYHEIRNNQSVENAETFLRTHATAIHVTPFGGCTHDFSQAPCPKHLQCWNGCSHLHRTNTPGEPERIQELITHSEATLNSIKRESEEEYGTDVWIKDLHSKIDNMKKALNIKPIDTPIKVFPKGKQYTIALDHVKGSSVS